MSEDTLKKLGTVRDQDEGRDAIHIAVVTMRAPRRIVAYGKQPVNVHGHPVYNGSPEEVGIIDPFLPEGTTIEQGQWFFVYLKPGTITGLKHVWTHPLFPEPKPKLALPDGRVLTELTSAPAKEDRTAILPHLKDQATQRVQQFLAEADVSLDMAGFIEVLTTGEHGRYSIDRWSGNSIHCDGGDASGNIPETILADVELIIGKKLTHRPEYFSCAC